MKVAIIHRVSKTQWNRLLACGFKFTLWKPSLSARLIWVLSALVFSYSHSLTIAQDTMEGLARPEWRMRADLEFRLACQSSLQKLCLELIETQTKDPSDPENTKLLAIAKELLETTDGKLPSTLPKHPASAEYIKSRKAAVSEWSKAYKARGRELPANAIESERSFQESHRDKTERAANSKPDDSESASGNNLSTPTAAESMDNRTTGRDSKNVEKKLEEITIRSLVSLIKKVDQYRSTKPAGDTTLEREQSKRVAKELITKYADNQPDCYFSYPIKDVSGSSTSLRFDVDEPIEFKQLRKELNADLQLTRRPRSINVKSIEILKLSSSIKPGDFLRVRFKVQFLGFGSIENVSNAIFDVRHSAVVGDPSLGDGNSLFSEKSIIDIQLVKKPASTDRSR